MEENRAAGGAALSPASYARPVCPHLLAITMQIAEGFVRADLEKRTPPKKAGFVSSLTCPFGQVVVLTALTNNQLRVDTFNSRCRCPQPSVALLSAYCCSRCSRRAANLMRSLPPIPIVRKPWSKCPLIFLFFALMVGAHVAHAKAPDPIAPYRAAREAFVRNYMVTGASDPAALSQNIPKLKSIAATISGEVRARALLELGYIQRVSHALTEAASTYAQAAKAATPLGRTDIVFDAWIGLARTHNDARDYGAAADALEHAISASGANPTPKQRFDLAVYSEEFAYWRGETESALVGALDALRLAPTPEDRFWGEWDTGDALEELAKTCDYRQLRDSITNSDPTDDGWGACRRAVSAAETAYKRAARTADGLGWKSMANQARETIGELAVRRMVIESHARNLTGGFTPRSIKDVLVHKGDAARRFLAEARKAPSEYADLLALAERTIDFAVSAQATESHGPLALRANLEEMRAGNTEHSTELFTRAAELLKRERASFFDPRRRGTVLEGQGGLLANFALHLLALKQDAAGFDTFELSRARGLGELAEVLARKDVSIDDRAWLAQQVRLDAEAGAAELRIVENVIGQGIIDRPSDELTVWEKYERERRSHLLGRPDLRNRFARSSFSPSSLVDLRRAASSAGVPVLLYWVADPNVYAWYIGPHGSHFRIIFLPETVLKEKIARVNAMSDQDAAFDEAAARELYLYLVAPFDDLLDSRQLVIVPQGEIVDVPFEALVEPETGKFVVERRTVSYAPNATMAVRSLMRSAPSIKRVTAVGDPEIDNITEETKGIGSIKGLQLRTLNWGAVAPNKLVESLRGAQSVHLLVHGTFDAWEPLLSTLGGHGTHSISAAELLALPLRGTKLVVMSACESAELQRRISNEIYGFPWALLAAGAENIVASRWRVNGASNSQWMRFYYAAISSGASPAEAGSAAMRSMLAKGQRRPYYWAAMQVIGR